MDADGFRRLFAYNRWANERVVARAEEASGADYFGAADGLSFGTLHATLVHILLAELVWLARWQGSKPPEALKDGRRAATLALTEIPTFARLTQIWTEESVKQTLFFTSLTNEMLTSAVHYEDQYGNQNSQPLWQLMIHLFNHGTQFRAEAAVRLTQLGRSPGDLDLIVWLRQQLQ